MIPSADKVITAHLKTDAAVTTITDRIGGTTPSSIADPWVRITLLGDAPTDGGITDHLIAAYLQIDCFAGREGTQEIADNLSRAVRAALVTANTATHTGAVVTGCGNPTRARMPDTDFEPAMELYVLTATIYMHE